ncbi:MAG: hypothetical protein R3D28_22160 [Geminicoccaceae bacterium]
MTSIEALELELQRYTLTLVERRNAAALLSPATPSATKGSSAAPAGVEPRFDQAWRFPTRTHLEALVDLLNGRPAAQGLAEAAAGF